MPFESLTTGVGQVLGFFTCEARLWAHRSDRSPWRFRNVSCFSPGPTSLASGVGQNGDAFSTMMAVARSR
ncbi:hypothetical protein [Paremcibacter congregatus]|uniref:hypothetical protein n=1 Tax=Paremcibacter congregatus TaxID=2043170 RepID=UPI003A8DBAAC